MEFFPNVKKIGFEGQLYIEPKPKEPMKHQYDFDSTTVYGFLLKNGLEKDYKINVEANHATLTGHTFHHELEFCAMNGVDTNRGDELLGWDTDQSPMNIYDTTLAVYSILKCGGFTTGGLNFDARVRRQSIDLEDLFYAHIGAMDVFARGLKNAARMIEYGRLTDIVKQRYSKWDTGIGQEIESGKMGFEELEAYTLEHGEPKLESSRQEMIENILNEYV